MKCCARGTLPNIGANGLGDANDAESDVIFFKCGTAKGYRAISRILFAGSEGVVIDKVRREVYFGLYSDVGCPGLGLYAGGHCARLNGGHEQ